MSSLLLSVGLPGLEVADGAMTLGLDDSSSVDEEWVNHWISACDSSTPQNWRSYLKEPIFIFRHDSWWLKVWMNRSFACTHWSSGAVVANEYIIEATAYCQQILGEFFNSGIVL